MIWGRYTETTLRGLGPSISLLILLSAPSLSAEVLRPPPIEHTLVEISPRPHLGVGAAMTVSGLVGGRASYAHDALRFDMVVGAQFAEGEEGASVFSSGGGFGAFYAISLHEDLSLQLGGRALLTRLDSSVGNDFQITIEAPVHLEWFFARTASIHLEAGPVLALPTGKMGVSSGQLSSGDPSVSLGSGNFVAGGFTLFL